MFWSIIWQALTGNLNGIVKTILGYFDKASDAKVAQITALSKADRDVAVAQLQAAASTYHDRVDMLKSMRITQWLIAFALIPPLLHQGMIFLDSTPFPFLWWDGIQMHTIGIWQVPHAPAPFEEREWQMIASLLGIQTVFALGLGLTKMILRR